MLPCKSIYHKQWTCEIVLNEKMFFFFIYKSYSVKQKTDIFAHSVLQNSSISVNLECQCPSLTIRFLIGFTTWLWQGHFNTWICLYQKDPFVVCWRFFFCWKVNRHPSVRSCAASDSFYSQKKRKMIVPSMIFFFVKIHAAVLTLSCTVVTTVDSYLKAFFLWICML